MRLAFALAGITFAGVAAASPTKDRCVDADTFGQSHRQAGGLHAARAEFRVCVDPACPAIVRSDCKMRLEEIDRVMPTIVLDPPVDLAAAKITMDGVLIAGTDPIEVDPGAHRFVLRVGSLPPVTREVVIAEGDKARRVTFDRPTAVISPTPKPGGMRPLRVGGIVAGALGLVSVGFGIAFGLASFGAWSSVESECFQAAVCDLARATRDRQRTLDLASASDATFIAGGVLLAAGVTLFLLGGSVAPTASRDGLGLSFTRTF